MVDADMNPQIDNMDDEDDSSLAFVSSPTDPTALAGRVATLADRSLELECGRSVSLGQTATALLVSAPVCAIALTVAFLIASAQFDGMATVLLAIIYLTSLLLLVASFILSIVSRMRLGDTGLATPRALARTLDGFGSASFQMPRRRQPRTSSDSEGDEVLEASGPRERGPEDAASRSLEEVRATRFYCDSLQGSYDSLRQKNRATSAMLKTSLGLLIGSVGVYVVLIITNFVLTLVQL